MSKISMRKISEILRQRYELKRSYRDIGASLNISISTITKDELLINITIYWITQTINSSMRLYYEYTKSPWILGAHEKISVPCGVASLPGEGCVREWGERFYNIQHWKEYSYGGHFPALENPEIPIAELRTFFRRFRGEN